MTADEGQAAAERPQPAPREPRSTRLHVHGRTLLRAVTAATANLERHVGEVDALNVFPVPDGDTGSNMLATMRAALAEAGQLPANQRDLDHVAEALSRGALIGARGNSGVILSQIIRGMTDQAQGRQHANGLDLAAGLRNGSDAAYGSVLAPVEGTILTVVRDAAAAAEASAGRQPNVEAVLAAVIEAAAVSVQRTPALLPLLEDAGVVDSGGQGLYRVLEGMLHVGLVDGTAASTRDLPGATPDAADADGDPHAEHRAPHVSAAHGYETQYLLATDAAAIDVAALRYAIMAVGDSVVVAGDGSRVRVHVHGDRPDLAIAAGLPHGRLSHVEIRDLDDQVAHVAGAQSATGIALVAASSAPGLVTVLASLGARVVRPESGSRPSAGEIASAVVATGAPQVIVLPNDRDALLAARLAASLTSQVTVEVVGTRNAAEGIAAALAFDPAASLDENARRMGFESTGLRSFSVVTAARDASVDGRPVRHGDIIALDAARHLLGAGTSVEEATMQALAHYEDYELVTVYLGADVGSDLAPRLREQIGALGAEVEVVAGGQLHEHLLVAVE